MDFGCENCDNEEISKGEEDLPWKLRSRGFGFLRMARVRGEVLWELAGQRLKKELWRLGENEIELP